MNKRTFLSYETKIILSIIIVLSTFFLAIYFIDYFVLIKTNLVNFYNEHLLKYPLWLQVLVLLLPIIIYILIIQIRKNRSDYKEDIFYNIKCKWEWSKVEVINLQCFCPTCGEELYYDSLYNDNNLKLQKLDFICDRCNKVVGSIPYSNNVSRSSLNVKREIQRLIKKKVNNF